MAARRKARARSAVELLLDEVVSYGGIPTRKWDLWRYFHEALGLREPHMAFGWMLKPAESREPWVRFSPEATDKLLGPGWERLPTWGHVPVHVAIATDVAVCGAPGPFRETEDPADCACCLAGAR
ncbi:MAG: hypothetical protein AB7I13_00180 [Vicinamibacterales bacterium]